MTKPVPLALPVLPGFGGPPPASLAATCLGTVKSDAATASSPFCLTLLTQSPSIAISGPVETRLNCSVVRSDTATIRFAFWKLWATFGGRIAVAIDSEFAVANSFACSWPSNTTSIGTVPPLLRWKLGLAKPSSQPFRTFCPTTSVTPLPNVELAAQCEKLPALSLKAPPFQVPTLILPNGPPACAIETTAACNRHETSNALRIPEPSPATLPHSP